MKKTINIYRRIIEETDRGYFIVYYIDKEDETYEEVIRIDHLVLQTEGDPPPLIDYELFDQIQGCLKPGLYFCVSRGDIGSESFTRDVGNPSLRNPVLPDSKT